MTSNSFDTRDTLRVDDTAYTVYHLDRIEGAQQLPYSLKALLENLLRNEDGERITAEQIQALAEWPEKHVRTQEIQYTPARELSVAATDPQGQT